jgi:hypothetical protein
MFLIPDDPIIRSMENTGYPPWLAGFSGDEEEDDDVEEE